MPTLPPPATNILMLPLVKCTAQVGTNEDWLDGFAFFVDDEETEEIDLSGIYFEMEMRAVPPDPSVAVRASSTEGTLNVAGHTLSINVPAATMAHVPPGDYVFDIIAKAEGRQRIIVQGTAMVVFQGITR